MNASPASAATSPLQQPHRQLPLSSSKADFYAEAARQIELFKQTALVGKVIAGTVTMADYHAILTTLFHQTRSSPYTFAKAGAHCDWKHAPAKDYLVVHANEERIHWQWLLDDLTHTGYAGPDPRNLFPHPTCAAYISFNEYIAVAQPVARLAIATVLEGIGAAHGATYGKQLLQTLGLGVEGASFFLSHGETDTAHIEDLRQIIDQCELDAEEWAWMTHAAQVGGTLYRGMYDHEAFR
jgi:hypothetical protein